MSTISAASSTPTQVAITTLVDSTTPSSEPIPSFRTQSLTTAKMVAMYTVFGRQVGSHYLAMGVLGALFSGTYLALSGGSKKTTQIPPINASTPDEADFIQNFLKQADADEKKAKH
ncbi:hypothetical protein GGR51DRAFT_573145 [Nemania sp. FL0031]|nr:hypothetical protein GGR51DRAFT_573145 [Nemania sp. FL0031]